MWKYVKEFAMEEDAVGVVEIILILVVLMTHVQAFLKDEQGITTVEIILILVVLISLVIIFKEQLTALVKKILTKITKQSNTI